MQSTPFISSAFEQKPTLSSRWLPVAPRGLGTPLQESLPSYLNRLARAHSLQVTTFLSGELAPLLNPGANYRSVSNYLGKASRYLLLGDGLASWVAAHVAQLTLIPEVTTLVHAHIGKGLGWTRDVRGHVAWCPECFREWERDREQIYFPLSWAFRATRCCLYHGVILQEACARCGRRFSYLDGRSWKGKCFHCQRSFAEECQVLIPSALDVRCTQLVQGLVAWSNGFAAPEDCGAILQENLARAATIVGGAKTLSRLIGRSPTVVGFWLRRRQNPTLGSLLRLSLAFGIPLELWLSVALGLTSFQNIEPIPKCVIWLSDRTHSVTAEHIEKELHSCLANSPDPPPSLFELARRIPASSSHLYRTFPDLVARIVERHRLYRTQRKVAYATKLTGLVRAAIAERQTQGLSVTADAILTHLGFRWPLSRRRLRAVFREVHHPHASSPSEKLTKP